MRSVRKQKVEYLVEKEKKNNNTTHSCYLGVGSGALGKAVETIRSSRMDSLAPHLPPVVICSPSLWNWQRDRGNSEWGSELPQIEQNRKADIVNNFNCILYPCITDYPKMKQLKTMHTYYLTVSLYGKSSQPGLSLLGSLRSWSHFKVSLRKELLLRPCGHWQGSILWSLMTSVPLWLWFLTM